MIAAQLLPRWGSWREAPEGDFDSLT